MGKMDDVMKWQHKIFAHCVHVYLYLYVDLNKRLVIDIDKTALIMGYEYKMTWLYTIIKNWNHIQQIRLLWI